MKNSKFQIMNSEHELVLNLCELNFVLVLVKCECAQQWRLRSVWYTAVVGLSLCQSNINYFNYFNITLRPQDKGLTEKPKNAGKAIIFFNLC